VSAPLDALRRLSASSLNLLLTRAQFASLELAQSRAQLMRWLGLALMVAVAALLAMMAASALLVILLWESAGPLTLAALAFAYAAVGVIVWRRLQRELREAPPLLAETLAELAQDRDAFLGRAPGPESSAGKS
jgi:uncharacterized membrane protein YqjE